MGFVNRKFNRKCSAVFVVICCLSVILSVSLVVSQIIFSEKYASAETSSKSVDDSSIAIFGDSYSSGAGLVGDYYDQDCLKSHNSYGELIAADSNVKGEAVNYSCAGDVVSDIAGQVSKFNQGAQVPTVAYMTIGGNDVGWTNVIQDCLMLNADLGGTLGSVAEGTVNKMLPGCQVPADSSAESVQNAVNLISGTKNLANGKTLKQSLIDAYKNVDSAINSSAMLAKRNGNRAKIVILPYGHLLEEGIDCTNGKMFTDTANQALLAAINAYIQTLGMSSMVSVNSVSIDINPEVVTMLSKINDSLDDLISVAVTETQNELGNDSIFYADQVRDVTVDHSACTSENYINKIDFTKLLVNPVSVNPSPSSVHPNLTGNQKEMAALLNEFPHQSAVNPIPVNPTPVDPQPTSVSVSKTSLSLKQGGTYQLTGTAKSTAGTLSSANKKLTWSSSDKSIVSVSSTGKVTANKVGTATITVRTVNGKTAKCQVTVILPTAKKVYKNNFKDIKNYSGFKSNIVWMYNHGVTTGTDKTHYNPTGNVTRLQMAIFLYRLMGSPDYSGSLNKFKDVSKSKYDSDTRKAVAWLAATKTTTGMNGKYNPSGNVTRMQMALFMYRLAGSPTESTSNKYKVKDWDKGWNKECKQAINFLLAKGVSTQKKAAYNANSLVSRVAMAAFMNRLYDNVLIK